MDITKKLYRNILGFIKDRSEDTILDGVMIDGRNRRESVVEWYDGYKDLRKRVDNLREKFIESDKIISVEDPLFRELILGLKNDYNWISSPGEKANVEMTEGQFVKLQNHGRFVKSFTEVVKYPILENFRELGEQWRRAINGDRKLRINRIFAACTYDVSSMVSVEAFIIVFDVFHKYKLINPYPKERVMEAEFLYEEQWYNQNVYLMEELHRIFKDELDSGKADLTLLSIFVWEIYKLKREYPHKLESFGI